MKFQIKMTFSLLLTLTLLALSATAQAAGQAQLRLSLENAPSATAQEVTVTVLVENAPQIYGADVRLLFDPNVLEVVDADDSQAGVQLEPGDFINFDQAFILQHQVDNQAGSIDYALALLNPAPPVQGDGLLARVTFRVKVDGQTAIHLESGQLGTQTGETITPQLENGEISLAVIAGSQSPAPAAAVDESSSEAAPLPATNETGSEIIVSEVPQPHNDSLLPVAQKTGHNPRFFAVEETETDSNFLFGLIILGSGGMIIALATLGGVGLVVGWFWLNRRRRS